MPSRFISTPLTNRFGFPSLLRSTPAVAMGSVANVVALTVGDRGVEGVLVGDIGTAIPEADAM
jgi:hypothetical protein